MREINKTEFETVILNGITFVDFYANWCGPCKQLAPMLDKLAESFTGKVNFYKMELDTENNSEVFDFLGVKNVPTVIVFKDGQEIKREVGSRPRHVYEKILTELL